MSHQLRNWMCEEGVDGDHCDSEAMDWAVGKITSLTAERDAAIARAEKLTQDALLHNAMLKGANDHAMDMKERAEKAEADCQVWCERHNGLEVALSDENAKVLELQAIVDRQKRALDGIFQASQSELASGGEMWYAEAVSPAIAAAKTMMAEKGGSKRAKKQKTGESPRQGEAMISSLKKQLKLTRCVIDSIQKRDDHTLEEAQRAIGLTVDSMILLFEIDKDKKTLKNNFCKATEGLCLRAEYADKNSLELLKRLEEWQAMCLKLAIENKSLKKETP